MDLTVDRQCKSPADESVRVLVFIRLSGKKVPQMTSAVGAALSHDSPVNCDVNSWSVWTGQLTHRSLIWARFVFVKEILSLATRREAVEVKWSVCDCTLLSLSPWGGVSTQAERTNQRADLVSVLPVISGDICRHSICSCGTFIFLNMQSDDAHVNTFIIIAQLCSTCGAKNTDLSCLGRFYICQRK